MNNEHVTCDFRILKGITISDHKETDKKCIIFRGINLASEFAYGTIGIPYSFESTQESMIWMNNNMSIMVKAIDKAWSNSVESNKRQIARNWGCEAYKNNIKQYEIWKEEFCK